MASTSSGDNGNVYQIVNNRDGNRTQNFAYDPLNRIGEAYTSGPNWGEIYTIDPWGNLTNIGPVAGKTNSELLNAAPAGVNNQLNGLGYDAAGNVTSNGILGYTYDMESHLTKFVDNSSDIYVYDGDGRRVKKNASGVTLYWYGATGNVLDETDGAGNLVSEYVFFNGKRIARRDADNSVKFYFSDNLGSASVITDSQGDMPPLAESDYYPYGGELPITSGDFNHYKFTGKERDAESGNDYFGARYYSSNMGRFMSPDPLLNSGRPWAPQTWNRFVYTRNNPLRYIDPSGLYDYDACKRTRSDECASQNQNQKRFDDVVAKAKELLKTLPKDSKEYAEAKKALDAIGTRGDGNGVKIDFGKTVTGGPMERNGQHITVDWAVFDKGVQMYQEAGYKPDPTVAAAAEVGHEGTHFTQPPLPMWAANKWDIDEGNEREAYGVQSAISEAGHSDDLGGVWNESWANSADKETLRQNAVKSAAHESMDATRKNYYDNGGK